MSRLSDVLSLSTLWHSESIDAYHWEAMPTGLGPGSERWDVYVDDVPIATRVLGRNQLNALPIPVFDILCVEIAAGPDVGHASFSRAGTMRIYTAVPDFGLSFEGAAAAGNEINDPGPFRYTRPGAPNVDRVGPAGEVAVAVNSSKWTARASGRLQEFHVTDDVLVDRTRYLYDIDSKPSIDVRSVGLTGSIGSPRPLHHLVGGYVDTGDLAFFPLVGFEIPTQHELSTAGISGLLPFAGGDIRYAASYTESELGMRPNAAGVNLDWRQSVLTANAEARVHELRYGGGLRAVNAGTTSRLSSGRILTTHLYGRAEFDARPGWHQDLLVQWQQRGSRAAASIYGRTDVRLSTDHALSLSASYGHLLPDDQGLWTWLDHGYHLPLSDSLQHASLDDAPFALLLTADAAWTATPGERARVTVRGFLRQTKRDVAARYTIGYDSTTGGLDAAANLNTHVGGGTIGGSVAVDLAVIPEVRQQLAYVFEVVPWGDRTYQEHGQRVPSQRISYRLTFSPVDRFSLSTHVRYASTAEWPAFESAAARSSYTSRLEEHVLVDVMASKRFWNDHLAASLALRNVLNEPIRHHPAGAVHHMALHFAVRINVTSEAGF